MLLHYLLQYLFLLVLKISLLGEIFQQRERFFRSSCSRPEVFYKKGVLRNFTKSKTKHLRQSVFTAKLYALELLLQLQKLWHGYFQNCLKNTYGLYLKFFRPDNWKEKKFSKQGSLTKFFPTNPLNNLVLTFVYVSRVLHFPQTAYFRSMKKTCLLNPLVKNISPVNLISGFSLS